MPESIRPTSTQKFTRCPTLWLYEDVQGWRKPHEPFSVARAMGTALHAGMAEYWRGRQGYDAPLALPRQPRAMAQLALVKEWAGHEGQAEESFEGMSALLDKCLDATIAYCAQHMRTEDAILIEQPLGEDGHTTPDLVTRGFNPDLDRGMVITDYKFHLQVKPEHLPYRLQNPEQSHQFQHYIWAVSEYLQEPVRLFRALHIVGLPKVLVREATFVPQPAQQAEWLRQAKRKWHQMAQIRVDPALVWRNENGCQLYGEKYPCPMWAACWDCHGGQEAMAQFYVKEVKG